MKIKNFLFSKTNKELLIFLLFFLLSATFWISQTLSDEFEVEINVPIKWNGLSNDVILTSELPTHITLNVRDKGTLLVSYVYGKRTPAIAIDCAAYTNGVTAGRVAIPVSEIREQIENKLPSSTVILSLSPDTLEYFFNKGDHKKIPVAPAGNIQASPEYYVRQVTFRPDSVTAYAPTAILDTLKNAYTAPLYLTDLKENKNISAPLQKVRGTKFAPERVSMNIMVDMFTEKTVEVPITGINFPATKTLRTFPSKVNVSFRVGMYAFKDVTAKDFVIAVSYEELLQLNGEKLRVRLKAWPQNVSNIKIEPAQVDYLIEYD